MAKAKEYYGVKSPEQRVFDNSDNCKVFDNRSELNPQSAEADEEEFVHAFELFSQLPVTKVTGLQ